MNGTLILQGGRILDPASGRDAPGELLVANGRIVDTLPPQARRSAEVVDVSGLVVCPGLVDIHVHLREPGQTHKETIDTGTQAAAAGGFTTIVCMPNTRPAADTPGTIQYIRDAIERDACVRVFPTGAITVGLEGKALAPIGSLKKAGVVAITDDGHCVQNNELMRRAAEYAGMFGLPVLDHCQDYALTEGAVMNEGVTSHRLGLRGWPAAAEEIIVARNVVLATHTRCHIHLQHLSSRGSVDIVRRAKTRGVPISAEVTPHHLHLTDALLAGYDTNLKVNPPVRTEDDRQALIDGLADGTIDCIGTDHAPHTNYEKDVEFDNAPFGLIGLETALAVCLEAVYHTRRISLPALISRLTCRAADLLKLNAGTLAPGAPADITVFDPDEPWVVDPRRFFSKSANCPWAGQRLRGRVRKTFVGGLLVYDEGRIVRHIGTPGA